MFRDVFMLEMALGLSDGSGWVIDDGASVRTYEIDTVPDGVAPGNVLVDFSAVVTLEDAAVATAAAINADRDAGNILVTALVGVFGGTPSVFVVHAVDGVRTLGATRLEAEQPGSLVELVDVPESLMARPVPARIGPWLVAVPPPTFTLWGIAPVILPS